MVIFTSSKRHRRGVSAASDVADNGSL